MSCICDFSFLEVFKKMIINYKLTVSFLGPNLRVQVVKIPHFRFSFLRYFNTFPGWDYLGRSLVIKPTDWSVVHNSAEVRSAAGSGLTGI